MIEDKLNHDERLRLECLAQATALYPMGNVKPSPDQLIERAAKYEAFVRGPDGGGEEHAE